MKRSLTCAPRSSENPDPDGSEGSELDDRALLSRTYTNALGVNSQREPYSHPHGSPEYAALIDPPVRGGSLLCRSPRPSPEPISGGGSATRQSFEPSDEAVEFLKELREKYLVMINEIDNKIDEIAKKRQRT